MANSDIEQKVRVLNGNPDSVSQELPLKMELGCSVFLPEEEDDKDNVLLAADQITEESITLEQAGITELTNIFKKQHKQTEASNDDIGIVEMGGSFYCSGCDFVNTRKSAEKHLRSAHSAGKDVITAPDKTTREKEGLLKCQLCKGNYPQVGITIIHRIAVFL